MTTRATKNLISKIAAALVVAFFCALVPLGLQNSGQVQRSKAYAEAETPYSVAEAFLDRAARQADITGSQLVSTIGEIVTITTGRPVSAGAGLSPRATLAGNLGSLLDAADFPAWDTLSDADKEAWGSQENYQAAKFNSLMRGFGLGDDLDDFKGSGGSSFTFSDAASKRLQQIGRIGSLWAGGAAVKVSELQSMIEDRLTVDSWFPVSDDNVSVSFDATGIQEWPEEIPRNVDIGYGSEFYVYKPDGSLYRTFPGMSSRDVYWLVFSVGDNGAGVNLFAFDDEMFQVKGPSNNSTATFSDATLTSVEGYESYYWHYNITSYIRDWTSNMPVNRVNRSTNFDYRRVRIAIALMLDNGLTLPTGGGVLIPDYPDDPVNPDDRVYMPSDGIGTEENSYNYYFEAPDVPRPDNPYNPDDQTGGNQWAEETTANVLPIAQLPFDKLFPFCLLYDLPLLLHKIMDVSYTDSGGGLRAQSVPDYEKIVLDIPQPEGLETWHLEIELTWLKDLLVLVRPALQVLLLVGFLWGSISFWKAVITG